MELKEFKIIVLRDPMQPLKHGILTFNERDFLHLSFRDSMTNKEIKKEVLNTVINKLKNELEKLNE